MKVRFFDIVWDTDGEYVDLPSTVEMDDIDSALDLDSEGADVLSDRFDWCVLSFNYEIIS